MVKVCSLFVFVFALGATMTTGAIAEAVQEKKEPAKKKPLKEPYTEYVTVRAYVGQKDLEFLNAVPDVAAYRKTIKGKDYIAVNYSRNGWMKAKSTITDKDGVLWIVTADAKHGLAEGGNSYACLCPVQKATKP